MAFNNAKVASVTTRQIVYTAPLGTPAILIGVTMCNKTATSGLISLDIGGTNIISNVPLPANSSFSPLDGKIVLLPGESLYATSEVTMDVIVSVLEV